MKVGPNYTERRKVYEDLRFELPATRGAPQALRLSTFRAFFLVAFIAVLLGYL